MKRTLLLAGMMGLTVITLTSMAWAYGGCRCGYGRGAQCCGNGTCGGQPARWAQARNYDPGTVESIRGDVVKVENVKGRGRLGGIHLLVKTDNETVPVHVGPQWYLRDHDLVFNEGDRIEIHGSRADVNDEKVVIADRIACRNIEVKLRDSDGVPLWAGRGRAY